MRDQARYSISLDRMQAMWGAAKQAVRQGARGYAAAAKPDRKVAVLGAAGGIGQPLGLLMKVRLGEGVSATTPWPSPSRTTLKILWAGRRSTLQSQISLFTISQAHQEWPQISVISTPRPGPRYAPHIRRPPLHHLKLWVRQGVQHWSRQTAQHVAGVCWPGAAGRSTEWM